MDSTCDFCAEARKQDEGTLYRELFPGSEPRATPVADGYVVMPTLGPLARGHSLLVPELHATSIAAAADGLLIETRDLIERVRQGLSDACEEPILLFEHGVGGSGGGCGISHAHLHLVPTSLSASMHLPQPFTWRESSRDDWIEDAASLTEGYLMVSRHEDDYWLCEAANPASQLLRQWCASELDVAQWDWRRPTGVVPHHPLLEAAVAART